MAWLDLQIDVFQYFAAGFVFKLHSAENQLALWGIGGKSRAFIERFLMFPYEFGYASVRDQPGGHLHDQSAQIPDGPDDPDDHPCIGDVCANRYGAGHHHQAADYQAGQQLEARKDVGNRPENRVQPQHFSAAQELLPVFDVKLCTFVFLAREGLDHAHSGKIFLQSCG